MSFFLTFVNVKLWVKIEEKKYSRLCECECQAISRVMNQYTKYVNVTARMLSPTEYLHCKKNPCGIESKPFGKANTMNISLEIP